MHKEGKEGSHKYSICLGIASIVSLLYVIYQIAHIVLSYQDASLQNAATQLGTGIGITLSLPHLLFTVLATIFVIVAFFTNGFGFAITAGVLFCVAGVLLYVWIPFVIPSIVFTFIGSAFCHKKKVEKQEAEEEKKYRQEHPAPPVQHQRASFGNRAAGNTGFERTAQPSLASSYQQPMQAAPYANAYMQNPMMQAQTGMDPYAPISPIPMQTNPIMTPQSGYMAAAPVQGAPIGQPYAGFQEPTQTIAQPFMMTPPVAPAVPQPSASDRISTGYFDDFGNFHPGQGGNF